MTPKEKVLKKRPCAEIQLSAMHGFQVADYRWSQHAPEILASSRRGESEAWRNAARRLERKRG